MGGFDGKSVIVTGAASGIGRATARAFAAQGARVMLADVDAAGLAALAAELPGSAAVITDVADPAACQRMVNETVARFGRLDIAFNNAGIGAPPYADFMDMGVADWRRLVSVNLDGVFHSIRAEVPALRAAGGGAIINTASVASLIAQPGMASYVASKHAVAGLTKAVALDLVRDNIRVNAVCPGLTDTAILDSARDMPEVLRGFEAAVPMGRIAGPEEIASAVLFLASDAASYCVGTLLTVDGGVILS